MVVSALILISIVITQGFRIIDNENLVKEQIVKGTKTNILDAPFMVFLRLANRVYGSCSGIIVSPRYILTAAHCLSIPENIHVFTGVQDYFSENTRLRKKHQLVGFVIHPNYNSCPKANDIGLIRLKNPIAFDDHRQPIPLAPNDTILTTRSEITVYGYGRRNSDRTVPSVGQLYSIKETIRSYCSVSYRRELNSETYFCASAVGDTGGVCTGDSGGPAVIDGRVVGLTSATTNAKNCYDRSVNKFIDVGQFYNWILNETSDDAEYIKNLTKSEFFIDVNKL